MCVNTCGGVSARPGRGRNPQSGQLLPLLFENRDHDHVKQRLLVVHGRERAGEAERPAQLSGAVRSKPCPAGGGIGTGLSDMGATGHGARAATTTTPRLCRHLASHGTPTSDSPNCATPEQAAASRSGDDSPGRLMRRSLLDRSACTSPFRRESAPGERRVATVPSALSRLTAKGIEVTIETGAGTGAFLDDAAYEAAGARVAPDLSATLAGTDVTCKVQPPTPEEAGLLPEGSALVCPPPARHPPATRSSAARPAHLRLQPRPAPPHQPGPVDGRAFLPGDGDGLSGGLLAAERLPRFFPMFMTAAGTVPPAKVLVLGAGVAGLQAIATARRLGAVVRASTSDLPPR